MVRAIEPIEFPAGQAGNILRGALGTVAEKSVALYEDLFAPTNSRLQVSGFGDMPRPFVLRVRGLDGRHYASGDEFEIGLNLFRTDEQAVDYLTAAIGRFATVGLGPTRARIELQATRSHGVLDFGFEGNALASVDELELEFLTPTELKQDGEVVSPPEFNVLWARLMNRIGVLSEAYGEGPLALDRQALEAQATEVKLTGLHLQHVHQIRRSSRTGQTHPIGGFVGSVKYRGALAAFLPFLEVARWIGVGRQTTWGKGEVATHIYSG